MDFSIIIPTYNSAKYLKTCLDSIVALDYERAGFEIIVVDGGSSDQTLDIVKTYADIHVERSPNTSISNSRNIGAARARGQNLVFIDSDCAVEPKLLTYAVENLANYVCCGSFYKPAPHHGWVSRLWLTIEAKKEGPVEWVSAGTLVVKKTVYDDIGGFNENLQTSEDVDFGQRLKAQGHRILNDPRMASAHWGQSDSLRAFFMKEMWRGRSDLAELSKAGINLRSLMYPVFILVYLLAIAGLLLALLSGSGRFFAVCMVWFLAAPALLTLRSCLRKGQFADLAGMFTLNWVYLGARAVSLLYYNQFKDLFGSRS